MTEYYVRANSFAAPFVSDASEHYISAEDPVQALEFLAAEYRHPAGLYAAEAYASHYAYLHGAEPMAIWLSNHEAAVREARAAAREAGEGFGYYGRGPGDFEVNRKRIQVDDPKGGQAVVGRG